MTDVGVALGFWGLGALAVGAALAILLTNNLLHAVLFLVLCFIALAGLFITLTADFVAVVQVLVYTGAVGVLMVFAVMLTPSGERRNADTIFFGPGFVLAGLIAAVMGFVAFRTPWNTADNDGFNNESTVNLIGEALLNRWALPFEIASVVLLVAMIGALVLVRSDETPNPSEAVTADQPTADISPVSDEEAQALAAGRPSQ